MNPRNYFIDVVMGGVFISSKRRMARGESWIDVVKNTVFAVGMLWGMIAGFLFTLVLPTAAYYIDLDADGMLSVLNFVDPQYEFSDKVFSFFSFGLPEIAFGIYVGGGALIYYGVFRYFVGFEFLAGEAAALSEDEDACKYYRKKGYGFFLLLVFVWVFSFLFLFSPGVLLEEWKPSGER